MSRFTAPGRSLMLFAACFWFFTSTAGAQTDPRREVQQLFDQMVSLYNQLRFDDAVVVGEHLVRTAEVAFGPESEAVATYLNHLTEMYVAVGRFSEAEQATRRECAIFERRLGEEHRSVAGCLDNLGSLFVITGRFRDSEKVLGRASDIQERILSPDDHDIGISATNLAIAFASQGLYAEAEPFFRRALEIDKRASGPSAPDYLAVALSNLAGLLLVQGDYKGAEPLYRRALSIMELSRGPEHPNYIGILVKLGNLYSRQGQYLEAEALLLRAIAIAERVLGPDHPDLERSLTYLGDVYEGQRFYSRAELAYRRALGITVSAYGPNVPAVAALHDKLAWIYYHQGRLDEALVESRLAVTFSNERAVQSEAAISEGGISEQTNIRNQYLHYIAISSALSETNPLRAHSLDGDAFSVAQYPRQSKAALALSQSAVRFAAGSGRLAQVVRDRQDVVNRWRGLTRSLLRILARTREQRDAQAEARLREEIGDLEARLAILDRSIADEFPAYSELTRPGPVILSAAQALLAPDEALVVYTVTDDATFLWALRRDRFMTTRIRIGAAGLTDEVQSLRRLLDPDQNTTRPPRPFDVDRSNALYQRILAPAKPLLEGASHVIVVPDGALQSLPFSVLVTGPVKPVEQPADYREVPWFARSHAVTTLPAISSLRALRRFARPTAAERPFVGIGSPRLGDPTNCRPSIEAAGMLRGGSVDVNALRRLCPLPNAKEELEALARLQGTPGRDLYLGDEATKPKVQSLPLASYRIVDFATHALVADGNTANLAEPALVLTPPVLATADDDGLLTATEVAQLKLDADWVILSACNTAAGDGAPGAEGLSGLARAFFYAGARTMLVSHWSVHSVDAEELVVETLRILKNQPELGRAEALRRAEMAQLNSSSPDLVHPMAWAAFSLLGEGAVRKMAK